jgi:DNA-binding HxlR family transcriptional regulator
MTEGRQPTVKEKVLAALTKEGQSYKKLQAQIDGSPAISAVNKALRKLEAEGLAVRKRITKRGPEYRTGITVDRVHEPKVLWRLR